MQVIIISTAVNTVDCSLLMIAAWNRFRIPILNQNMMKYAKKNRIHLLAEQVIWIISNR